MIGGDAGRGRGMNSIAQGMNLITQGISHSPCQCMISRARRKDFQCPWHGSAHGMVSLTLGMISAPDIISIAHGMLSIARTAWFPRRTCFPLPRA